MMNKLENIKSTNFKNLKVCKKAFIQCSLLLLILIFSCNTKTKREDILASGKISKISFQKELHDFGEIPAKKEVTAIFSFSNSGENPLIIKSVKATCGCTVPEYSKDVIEIGEEGEVKVTYDAKRPGRFNKTITVFYNGKDSPKKLIIKGKVSYPQEIDIINK